MKKRKTLREKLKSDGIVPVDITENELEILLEEKKILVSGIPATSLARLVTDGEHVSLHTEKKYVGRGAHKLIGALDHFNLDVTNAIAADVGSSTGGFTQVLLERGAVKVYAIDVGYGELAWQIRSDKRVVVMERTNAREVDQLPEVVSIVTMDLSFISVTKVLPKVMQWMAPNGSIVSLIKPQFEADRDEIPIGGVIEDSSLIDKIVERTISAIEAIGLSCLDKTPSAIKGGDGNQEWFVLLKKK